MNIKLGKRILHFEVARIPDCPTLAINNELEDCSYFLVADYDNVDYDVILKDIRHVHDAFGLCSFVILEHSSKLVTGDNGVISEIGNYAVIGPDKLTYLECWKVMTHMRMDRLHRKIGMLYDKRNWAIRVFGKYEMKNGELVEFKPEPTVREVILYKGDCNFHHSNAVKVFLRKWFNVRLPLSVVPDGNIQFKEYMMIKK